MKTDMGRVLQKAEYIYSVLMQTMQSMFHRDILASCSFFHLGLHANWQREGSMQICMPIVPVLVEISSIQLHGPDLQFFI